MKNKSILVLHSSARALGSHSRELAAHLVERLQGAHPGAQVKTRDLAADPVPHVSAEFTSAIFVPPPAQTAEQQAALALSNTLVGELLAADILVISAPMYNLSVPSALKAWIDHIVRPGLTFSFGPEGFEGLLRGKQAYVVTPSGGVYSHGPRTAEDFNTPYLRQILGFVGITDVVFIRGEGLSYDPQAGLDAAEKAIAAAVA
jgi:FMN-dependent NADH-azoreductase